ncbi:MAG: dehydrogenase [Williamsia sp.]|nr:dehydrogenase [Williamsia sp.]
MQFDQKHYTNETLVGLYRNMLLSRLVEEKMLVLLRQGKVSKWFSGIGQEAISTGATLALEAEEWIMPLHRNLGVFVGRGMPLHKLFLQWQGGADGYSKGRERSFHFGSRDYFISGMISHLGPQLAVAAGTALAHKLQNQLHVSLAFTGEGATSEGDFHEALNIAAVWDLPVIFVIENNGYGLSTPVYEQYRCESLVDRAKGYGMEGVRIDGNNVLTVYDTVKGVREYCIRHQKPYLIECMTFRMRGHEEASGTRYVPEHLFEMWKHKDPVGNFKQFLLEQEILDRAAGETLHSELQAQIEEAWSRAVTAAPVIANTQQELEDVYAKKQATVNKKDTTPSSNLEGAAPEALAVQQQTPGSRELRFIDAIKEALFQSMETCEELILMGQDIAAYGGAFKITEGLAERFGKERVRNTPLCESGVVGVALGLALQGFKAMVEMQFADFVTAGFNQIVNNLAKLHYRWGEPASVVIRMPTGGGIGAGPFHSQSTEAWFMQVPGLKVVYPSSPTDAKGLLIAALNDPNPVLYFEHKALYRSIREEVPDTPFEIQIGEARLVQEGTDISIITYGMGVHWALEFAASHPEISIHLLDLRTLLPLDYAAIRAATAQTGKVLVLHEATLTAGPGAEIAAWITEHCFPLLDAPVLRCASLDTPVPFNTELENNFLAKARLGEYVDRLLKY